MLFRSWKPSRYEGSKVVDRETQREASRRAGGQTGSKRGKKGNGQAGGKVGGEVDKHESSRTERQEVQTISQTQQ